MSTGLETWTQNLNEVTELYPFVGSEMILAWAAIASWVIWHLIQIKSENAQLEEERAKFSDKARLAKAMEISNADSLNESLKGHASDF
ncbi:MAG: hypothetical protein RIC16_08210 [Rhodospirillales bacterium]